MTSILLVEDDLALHTFVKATLTDYTVNVVATATAGMNFLHTNPVDAVLLDLHLGSESGMEIAKYVRQNRVYTALIIMTGQGTLQTAIKAIELGAHAYLLKPVEPNALRDTIEQQISLLHNQRKRDKLADYMQAAVSAMQDGEEINLPGGVLTSGKLVLDRTRYNASYDDEDLSLSSSQFRVLWALVKAAGQPVTPTSLVREALEYEVSKAEASNLIKGYILQLRRKLAKCDNQREFIRTIRGHGYLWVR